MATEELEPERDDPLDMKRIVCPQCSGKGECHYRATRGWTRPRGSLRYRRPMKLGRCPRCAGKGSCLVPKRRRWR